MNAEERLKEYVERDEIYKEYKKDKLMNPSDFEMFCIQHCKDIEEILEENKQLKDNWNKLKKYINEANEDLYWTNNYDDILYVMQELEGSDSK